MVVARWEELDDDVGPAKANTARIPCMVIAPGYQRLPANISVYQPVRSLARGVGGLHRMHDLELSIRTMIFDGDDRHRGAVGFQEV
jgi:hypothetical protein